MRAKTLLLPLAVGLLTVGCKDDTTRAAESGSPPPLAAGETGLARTTGAPFAAEVVAIETDGRTITLREMTAGPSGVRESRAVRIDPTTAATVAALKPGDQVMITCEEVPTGGAGLTGPGAGAAGTGTGAYPGAAGVDTGTGTITSRLQACSVVVAAAPQSR
jgi:hypothetical protein